MPVSDRIRLNGVEYSASDIGAIRGTIEYSKVNPYLGLGYRKTFDNGLRVGFDAGVLHFGKPEIRMEAEIHNAEMQHSINVDLAEEVQNFRSEYTSEISKLNFVPVVRLSVGYTF